MTSAALDGAESFNSTEAMECPICAELISVRAKKCRYCNETLDVALRRAEEALRASERSGNVYMNAAVSAAPSYTLSTKSRVTAIVLALLLGGLGAHKFYLGRIGWGIIYLLFCWTFIPSLIALVEALVYAASSEEAFHAKYR